MDLQDILTTNLREIDHALHLEKQDDAATLLESLYRTVLQRMEQEPYLVIYPAMERYGKALLRLASPQLQGQKEYLMLQVLAWYEDRKLIDETSIAIAEAGKNGSNSKKRTHPFACSEVWQRYQIQESNLQIAEGIAAEERGENPAPMYLEALQHNPLSEEGRGLLALAATTQYITEMLQQEKRPFPYHDYAPGGKPLFESITEKEGRLTLHLGNKRSLFLDMISFGTSTHQVLKISRSWSNSFYELLQRYLPQSQPEAIKVYQNPKAAAVEVAVHHALAGKAITIPKMLHPTVNLNGIMVNRFQLIEGETLEEFLKQIMQKGGSETGMITYHLVKRVLEDVETVQQLKLDIPLEKPDYKEKTVLAIEKLAEHGKQPFGKRERAASVTLGDDLQQQLQPGTIVGFRDANLRNTCFDYNAIVHVLELTLVPQENATASLIAYYQRAEKKRRVLEVMMAHCYALDFEKMNKAAHWYDDVSRVFDHPMVKLSREQVQQLKTEIPMLQRPMSVQERRCIHFFRNLRTWYFMEQEGRPMRWKQYYLSKAKQYLTLLATEMKAAEVLLPFFNESIEKETQTIYTSPSAGEAWNGVFRNWQH
ncbi:hypothetical protein HZB02_01010 [Candidatus Woesearchaeota archaeon]|nr:hypothetical protein [Candidatus Woesearchaeota archaeon]